MDVSSVLPCTCLALKRKTSSITTELVKCVLQMMPEDVRGNMAVASGLGISSGTSAGDDWVLDSIVAFHHLNVVRKLILSGILNSGKCMPSQFLGAGGLILESELTDATSPLSTADNKSTQWHLSDVRVQAATINVDGKVQDAYSAHVLSGKSLLLPSRTFVCTASDLPDSDGHGLSIARNFTRLCTLLQTFVRPDSATEKECNTFHSPVSTTTQDNIE